MKYIPYLFIAAVLLIIVVSYLKYGRKGVFFSAKVKELIGELSFSKKNTGKSSVRVFSLESSPDHQIGLEWKVPGDSTYIKLSKDEVRELVEVLNKAIGK